MFRYLNKRGQSTLEYGVVIAVVVAALISMQTYIKRGVQGKLRQASDEIGEQFSPDKTTGVTTVTSHVGSTENLAGGDKPTTTTTSNQTQNRTGNESIATLNEENWPK